MSASKRAIFTIRTALFSSPALPFHFNCGLSRFCFSSLNQPQGDNRVDDIRKGADGDGTSGMSDRAKETMRDDLHRAKEQTRDMADSTRDMAGATSDTAGSVADMAKERAAKAMDTGMEMGEKAKQTLDAAWDGVKETTKNVKHSVLGDTDSERPTNQPTDSHVESLRRRAGGYDLRDE